MEKEKFCCQICCVKFTTICSFKRHLSASKHRHNFQKVYPNAKINMNRRCFTPHIFYKDYYFQQTEPILGLSLVTLCFSLEQNKAFYLCHVCDLKSPVSNLQTHISSWFHYRNYFAYTDPNALNFASKPSIISQWDTVKKEQEKTGIGELQVLHLPMTLQNQCGTKTYCQVMLLLHQNKMLSDIFKEIKPNRTSIQAYKDDANRKHPLLGLQYIVEYICESSYKIRRYLCTLCGLQVPSCMIIRHLLSFDHLFHYFNKWHPSTLVAKTCYQNDNDLVSTLTDFARQSEELYGLADIQQVKLNPSQFFSVQNACFRDALSEIESITKKSNWLPIVNPGMKLVPRQRQGKSPKATNESNVENIQSKSTDGIQSANQVPCFQTIGSMEMNLKEESTLNQQEIKTEDHELPNLSSPHAMEEVSALKRPGCLVDVDNSDSKREDVTPKGVCPSAPEEREENITGQCSSSDASVANLEPQHGWMLWSHVQKEDRKPLIGLSAVYECVCNNHAPIYMCDCCNLIFKEKNIASHLSETWHYKNYLEMMGENIVVSGKYWKRTLLELAANWERSNGYGEAQVVEMTADDYRKLTSISYFKTALRIVKNYLAMQKNEKNITCVDTTTANAQETSQQDVKEIDPEPVTALVKTDLSSKTETDSKSNQENTVTRPQSPEKATTTTATVSHSLTSTLTVTAKTQTFSSLSEETSLKMGDETPTVTSKRSKPVCTFIKTRRIIPDADSKKHESTITVEDTFITTRHEFPKAESKTASTSNHLDQTIGSMEINLKEESTWNQQEIKTEDHELPNLSSPHAMEEVSALKRQGCLVDVDTSDSKREDVTPKEEREENITGQCSKSCIENLEYITSTDTPTPNSELICAANRNVSTPVSTHLAPPSSDGIAISSKLSTENISLCDTDDDVTPNTPNPQDVQSIQSTPSNVCKRKVDSIMASETASKAARLGVDPLSANKAKTSTEYSETKLIPAAAAQSPSKTMDNHTKSTENHLRLNLSSATRITNVGPVHKIDSLSPTTPNCALQTPTPEVSERAAKNTPKIGLDQLLKVSCKESTHTYCFACSVLLEKSNHLTSTAHQINCVKAKYPGWGSKPNEDQLSTMVALIAEYEKAQKLECKNIEVSLDMYKELKRLPIDKAIEMARGMTKKSSKKPAQRRPSAPTSELSTSLCDISTSPSFSISPFDVTSPDLGKEKGQTKPQAKSIAEPIKKVPASSPSSPVQKPTSKVAPRIIKGSTTDDPSNLSYIIKVMDRPVIGLSFVWECRVIPSKRSTFYLCEICCHTFLVTEIYEHMTCAEHRWKYLMRQYPRFMYWTEEELLPEMVDELTRDIAGWVLSREEVTDAQTVLLSEECFEWVRTAPFVEALSVVKRLKQEKKMTTLPLIVPSQHDLQMETSILEEDRTTDSDHTTHGLDGNTAYANDESFPSVIESNNILSHITQKPNCFSNRHMSALPKDQNQELPKLVNDIATPLSQIKEPLVFQLPSANPPEQPEYLSTCFNQNISASPEEENQENFESENKVSASKSCPLSHNPTFGSPVPIYNIGTTSPTNLKDASSYTTHKTERELPSVREFCASTVISEQNDNVTKPIEEEHMVLEESPQFGSVSTGETTSVMASSTAGCNDTHSPALDPNAPKNVHMFQMLINLIKQNKHSLNLKEPCIPKASESNV